jgi:Protein of unknown function VcgC/VcgE (DUF2780)
MLPVPIVIGTTISFMFKVANSVTGANAGKPALAQHWAPRCRMQQGAENMAANIQSFVDQIAAKANVDPGAAETAVGTILFVIQKEGSATKVTQLFQQLPGAADLAQKYAVVAGSGGGILGTLGGVADKVVGGDAGILLAALAQIEATNLNVSQIKNIGSALLAYLKENANPELVTQIVEAIPSLRDHFAHQA